MNKQRRKDLDRAHSLLIEAQDIINGVLSDEEDARENIPENLYYSERAEQMEEYCYTLE